MARSTFACIAVLGIASAAHAQFVPFVIRNSPAINTVANGTEFVISAGGMKAGLGSNAVNGSTLGSITQMAINRVDDPTRFAPGSGPAVAPYVNFWITNGLGQFAVIANEPSNASFSAFRSNLSANPADGYAYDFSFSDILNEPAKVFETPGWNTDTSWVHVATGKTAATLTFADLVNFVVMPPDPAFIAAGNGIGSGAPREFGTNIAYGFNWVFGDTLTNYVSGMEGYIVNSPTLIPTPGTAAVLALGGLLAARRRRA